MTKKSCLDEEDRVCLLQIFSLLTNLEVMSQEQNTSVEDTCPGYAVGHSKILFIFLPLMVILNATQYF